MIGTSDNVITTSGQIETTAATLRNTENDNQNLSRGTNISIEISSSDASNACKFSTIFKKQYGCIQPLEDHPNFKSICYTTNGNHSVVIIKEGFCKMYQIFKRNYSCALTCDIKLSKTDNYNSFIGNCSCVYSAEKSSQVCDEKIVFRQAFYSCLSRDMSCNCSESRFTPKRLQAICHNSGSGSKESNFYKRLFVINECNCSKTRRCKEINTSIPETSLKPGISLVDKEISTLCKIYAINPNHCQCHLFSVMHTTQKISLCNITNFGYTLNYKASKSATFLVSVIINQFCVYLNLSDKDCICESFKVKHEERAYGLCVAVSTETTMSGLQGICDVFQIPKENCRCEMFRLGGDDQTYKSVCHLVESLPVVKTKMWFTVYSQIYAGIAAVSSVIGIAGNVLVIIIALRYKTDLPTCKMLIAHLATCDFIFAILQLIIAVPKFWTNKWLYGVFCCKLLFSSELLGISLSVGIILLISIERFIGIVNPFHGGLPEIVVVVILMVNVVIGAAAVTPMLIYSKIDDKGICLLKWPNGNSDSKLYNVIIVTMYFVIPVIIVSVLYGLIIRTLRRTATFENNRAIADPRMRLKRLYENRRTVCKLIAVVIAFVLFVLPSHVVKLYFNWLGWAGENGPKRSLHIDSYFILHFVASIPYPLHVAINPIIYSLIDAKWRKDVMHLILNIPNKTRSYSTTMISGVHMRRSSSCGPVFDGSMDDLRRIPLSKVQTVGASNFIELEPASPVPSRAAVRRTYLSSSSAKSIESMFQLVTSCQIPPNALVNKKSV